MKYYVVVQELKWIGFIVPPIVLIFWYICGFDAFLGATDVLPSFRNTWEAVGEDKGVS
jgi:hypothetical protein